MVSTMRLRALISVSTILLFAGTARASSVVRVTAEAVNLRAAPDPESEVVAQASKGDELQSLETRDGEWLAVRPPPHTGLWVYGDLLSSGKVTAERVKVRSGPGINYRTVGHLREGDSVVVMETVREWVKIAAPDTCQLWVNHKYVDMDTAPEIATNPPPAAGIPPIPPVAATVAVIPPISPVATAAPAPGDGYSQTNRPSPPAPASAHAHDRAPGKDGHPCKYQGELRPIGAILCRRPTDFRLVRRVPGSGQPATTLCYVAGPREKLSPLVGSVIEVTGREYEMRGLKYPYVVIDEIAVLKSSGGTSPSPSESDGRPPNKD